MGTREFSSPFTPSALRMRPRDRVRNASDERKGTNMRNIYGKTVTCTHCGSENVKPVCVPWDNRKWYQCKGCGKDFVTTPSK